MAKTLNFCALVTILYNGAPLSDALTRHSE